MSAKDILSLKARREPKAPPSPSAVKHKVPPESEPDVPDSEAEGGEGGAGGGDGGAGKGKAVIVKEEGTREARGRDEKRLRSPKRRRAEAEGEHACLLQGEEGVDTGCNRCDVP
jgi:hypothetical protein